MTEPEPRKPWHLAIEVGPVVVFFAVNFLWGLMAATAAVMAATLVAVGVGWFAERRLPAMALITLALVLLLGGASLVLQDELFIQLKPTVAKLLFALALGVGLLLKPTLLERALGHQVFMSAHGWRVLTWRWIALALAWAAANEVARQVLTVDDWVTFKLIMTIASIASYIAVTYRTVPRYWTGPVPD